MIESLKDLNERVQKPNYKTVGNWMVRRILRDAALPITWLLLHTPVTANQVTLAAILVGVLGASLLGCESNLMFLLGTLLLQFWYLLDHVDGQIARYRQTDCLTGRFFDFLMHHVVHGIVLFFLGFYVYRLRDENIFVLWGFFASVSMFSFNMIHDIKYKAFFEKLVKGKGRVEFKEGARDGEKAHKNREGVLKKTFSFIHKACEMHVLMNVLTLAAILQQFSGNAFDFRSNLFMVYALVVPVLSVVKISYIIHTRNIDKNFTETFKADPTWQKL